MTTKNISNRIILQVRSTLDLQALKKLVQEYINNYYGEKRKERKIVRNKYLSSILAVPSKITLTTVFNLFERRFIDDTTHIRKVFRYLNHNYSSTHKLRDLYIFKLKMDGYTFKQIVEITNLSIARVKQIYYIVKKT